MAQPDKLIEVDNFSGGYDTKRNIIKNVSFSVHRGETLAIIGPNGAGKSTIAKALMGQLPHTNGNICILGQDVSKLTPQQRAQRIAYVGSHMGSQSTMSVWQYVLTGRTPYRSLWTLDYSPIDKDIANEALRKIGIEKLKNMLMNMLSDGNRQLAVLARAVCQQTPIVILDEPTTNLDIRNQAKYVEAMRNLGNETATIMIVHDINMATQLSDTTMIIVDGEITHYGQTPTTLTTEKLQATFGVPFATTISPLNGKKIFIS